MSAISCPHCRGNISLDPSLAGQAVACPHCGGQVTMPQLATVRPVTPPVIGQGFPAVDTTPKPTGTVGSQHQRRKQKIPKWVWIAGGFCFLALFSLLDGAINGEARRAERERKEAEKAKLRLPTNATGHEWVEAPDWAKEEFVRAHRRNHSGLYDIKSNSELVRAVDFHYEMAQKDERLLHSSLNDKVTDAIWKNDTGLTRAQWELKRERARQSAELQRLRGY